MDRTPRGRGDARGRRSALLNRPLQPGKPAVPGSLGLCEPTGGLLESAGAGFEGQSADVEIHAREILQLRARVDEIYATHTGQSVERVHDDMERDRFFTAEQAMEYGLIDRVIDSHELTRVATGFAGS